ncbi:hypothetical protein [Anaeromyxobacter oryzae]|uniref:Uncharacterized protein n=1 Tax=Anaeromyxobacter oryzae TaxID=2918170 RepID=A0ABM7WZ54_9BACT|nr:hypothetical protein [Anaeromyxobacter oryzae]BDG04767.1 hypothetical protein AMOR_37630 [Anaeromyxobacter oryzae]
MTRETRSAASLALAAAVSLMGSALLLKGGRALPVMTGGAPEDHPGILLVAVVVLLAATGVLLLAMAGKGLLDSRRHPHAH